MLAIIGLYILGIIVSVPVLIVWDRYLENKFFNVRGYSSASDIAFSACVWPFVYMYIFYRSLVRVIEKFIK
jgi:hypothetical protein